MRLIEEPSLRLLQTVMLTALLTLSSVASGGTEPTTPEVVAAVESTYKDVQSLQANFVQITRNDFGETRQQGAVQLKRPRMMRWDFTQPAASSFITDGSKLWVWAPAENQVIVTEDLSGAASGSDMSQLLTDLSKLGELFNVEQVAEAEGTTSYTLKLTPKTGTNFKSLQIEVAREGYALQRVVVVDAFDAVVELDFSAVTINSDIPDDRFTFAAPDGATVIKTDGI
jgi:outer membrane lipoprotein carrier protein